MAVYKPTYKEKATGEIRQQAVWWYEFTFAGRRIRESSKSTRKTVAVEAEKNRRLELERTFNAIEDKRKDRIRSLKEVADTYMEHYRQRHKSITFAEHAIGHLKRLLGSMLLADIDGETVKDYQTARLKQKAAPKTINEEVGFLLRLLEDQGDVIRARMRRQKTLKLAVASQAGRAFSPQEKATLLREARKRRSPAIVPALMLALHAGLRDAEIRGLQWGRVDLIDGVVTVGDSKTQAGRGRTIPLNEDVLTVLKDHARWYLGKFGETRPEWYVFPYGKPQPTDQTKPATSFKTVWTKIRADAKVEGRWHDNRHTFVTDLAEAPTVSDETIRQLAGHVSKQMLEHYSHIRMEAKRRAVEALASKPTKKRGTDTVSDRPLQESPKVKAVQ